MKLACAAAFLAATGAFAADRIDPVPKALERVGVEEKLDAPLPLQLAFKDDRGEDVTLGTYFRPGKPVLLTFNYYRCPMLCTLELNGLVAGMKDLRWSPGEEYTVVTVGIDPNETPALARAKKQSYLEDFGRPQADAGWHFLTGSAESIAALTAAAGFSYEYDQEADQYGHAAVVLLVTPDGRVSRYLYGVVFPEATLKMALLQAADGAIGSSWERFLMTCYRYDATRGRYALAAMTLMRAGGALTVLTLACVLGVLWLRRG